MCLDCGQTHPSFQIFVTALLSLLVFLWLFIYIIRYRLLTSKQVPLPEKKRAAGSIEGGCAVERWSGRKKREKNESIEEIGFLCCFFFKKNMFSFSDQRSAQGPLTKGGISHLNSLRLLKLLYNKEKSFLFPLSFPFWEREKESSVALFASSLRRPQRRVEPKVQHAWKRLNLRIYIIKCSQFLLQFVCRRQNFDEAQEMFWWKRDIYFQSSSVALFLIGRDGRNERKILLLPSVGKRHINTSQRATTFPFFFSFPRLLAFFTFRRCHSFH